MAGRYLGQSLLFPGKSGTGAPVSGSRGAAPYQAVQVVGLAELQQSLKDIDPRLRKNLAKRFRDIARDVRDDVRAKIPLGPQQRGHSPGRARRGVTSGGGVHAAWVKLDKGKVPYLGWLDFGGKLKPKGKRKGLIVRPLTPGRRGRYLYPTVDEHLPATVAAAEKALAETKRELGLD